MSLVCSLVGHDWGEERVETESKEARGQAVVTEREYRECTRCGERRVVSENTEVRPAAGNESAKDESVSEGEEEDEVEEQTSTFAPSDDFETEETEDAAILDDSGTTTRDTDTAEDAGVGMDADTADDLQDRVRESTGTEVTRETTPDEDDDYVCPDCGFSSSDPSLRGGDICPNCGGYLEET
ncbi:MAG: hypothetical protein ACLFSW_04205 [Halobacteriales archaeon]